jgi:hypothetical protein
LTTLKEIPSERNQNQKWKKTPRRRFVEYVEEVRRKVMSCIIRVCVKDPSVMCIRSA